MRVTIDTANCRGHARCIAIAPDAFDFDESTDTAVVREGALDAVPAERVLAAANACPERAILVEDPPSA